MLDEPPDYSGFAASERTLFELIKLSVGGTTGVVASTMVLDSLFTEREFSFVVFILAIGGAWIAYDAFKKNKGLSPGEKSLRYQKWSPIIEEIVSRARRELEMDLSEGLEHRIDHYLKTEIEKFRLRLKT